MSNYLVYGTFDAALQKADDEGIARNLPYYSGNGASRWVSYPLELTNGKWALNVSDYKHLTNTETLSTVTSVTFA